MTIDGDRTGNKDCAQRYPQSPPSNKPPPFPIGPFSEGPENNNTTPPEGAW